MFSKRAALDCLAAIAAAAAVVALGSPATAAISDPAGDFLATYTGPQSGDLDLLSVEAVYLGGSVSLSTTVNGAVGTTAGAFYPWLVNRGAGTEGLFASTTPVIGAGMLHDAVVIMRPNLTGMVVLVGPGGSLTFTPLAAGTISVSGDTIMGLIPLSMLPANGFSPDDYTYAALGRSGAGSNAFVSDFAPDSAPATATVPEPGAWALMLLGFTVAGAAIRSRRRWAGQAA